MLPEVVERPLKQSTVRERRPEYNADGVDVSLVAAFLALTPEERFEQNDRMVRTILELRRGFAALEK